MEHLAEFVAVAEEGSFVAAARRLDTTTASISRRIKALEQHLGVRLFQRTTRTIQLTEAGELYYPTARQVLDDLAVARDQLQRVATEPHGSLRVVAPMSYGQRRIAPVVATFAAAHPGLHISLRLDDEETDLVREGFDLALRISHPFDSTHVARPIVPVPRLLCAAPAYLARRGTPATPADLLHHDCLHYSVLATTEEWTFDGPGGSQAIAVDGRFCSNNGEALMAGAVAGLGIALLPEFIIAEALADGRLVRVLAGHERPPLTLYAVYPSRHQLPAKLRLFMDHILRELG